MTEGARLRERKKLATRQALSSAALRLAVERGAEHVTARDIADEAEVSVRTFFNYFETKEAAFVGDDVARARQFIDAVRAAPDEAPLWELLHASAITAFSASGPLSREQALKETLVRTNPTVVAEVLTTFLRFEEELVVELTRRVVPCEPLRARLLAHAVGSAVRAATETWLSGDPHRAAADYPDLLDEAFCLLRPAFP